MNVWRSISWMGLGLLALLATACATEQSTGVGSTYDPLTRFPATATWSWDEHANKMPDDSRIEALDVDAIIRQVSAEEFGRKGYTEVGRDQGEFLLHYELGIATWNSRTAATAVGSVSLSLVDARSGRRVWVGFWRAEVDVSLDREARVERFRTEVAELLKTFPPGQPH